MTTKNPGLTPFTFKDTGRTVLIRKVSPMLVMELSRAFPAPKPPMQPVDYGDGREHIEPNPNNPEYLADLQQYQIDFQQKLQTLMIKRGICVEMTPETRQEVKELREFWQAEYGKDLNASDDMVYVLNLCVGSQEDLEDLLNAISRRSQPTEPAVKETLESFKS